MIKKILFILFSFSALCYAGPRNPFPDNPSKVWQNDSDLEDLIDGRINDGANGPCIDDPTLCVDENTNRVGISTNSPDSELHLWDHQPQDKIEFEIENSSDNGHVRITLTAPGDISPGAGLSIRKWGVDALGTSDLGLTRSDLVEIKANVQPLSAIEINMGSGGTFHIGEGSNEQFQITADGEVLKPRNPIFAAYVSASTSNVTGDSTQYQVEFDAEEYDLSSDYSTSGVFTAGVAGKYQFNANVALQDIDSASHVDLQIDLVTSNFTYSRREDAPNGTPSVHSIGISQIAHLDDGDTAFIQIRVNSGTKVVDVQGSGSSGVTFFSGALLQ